MANRVASALRRTLVALLLAALTYGVAPVAIARADGDPASDYLLAQQVFLTTASGSPSAPQQQLLKLVRGVNNAGFAIRVAIIASPADLGSITALWRHPLVYARFLGEELTLGYKGRLLVVMPTGFGFNWPAHSSAPEYRLLAKVPISGGRNGLATTAASAVRRLALAAHVSPAAIKQGTTGAAPAATSQGTPALTILIIVGAVCIGAALAIIGARARRRRPRVAIRRRPAPVRGPLSLRTHVAIATVVFFFCAGGVAAGITLATGGRGGSSGVSTAPAPTQLQESSVVTPPPVSWPANHRRAPNFRLRDQSGGPVSVSQYRGREVIVTFIDPVCHNICPLEAQVLDQAVQRLPLAKRPEVLAVSVNPYADARANLLTDARKWNLVPEWRWAVGSRSQLAAVWKDYRLQVVITRKQIAGKTITAVTHTSAAYLIDATGHERALFIWPFYPQDVVHELRELDP